MKRLLSFAALLLLLSPLTAQRAQAQFEFVPYLGYNFDAENLLVGVGAEFNFLPGVAPVNLSLRPSIEYLFTDDGGLDELGIDVSTTALQINADVMAELSPPAANLGFFAGAGLALGYASVSIEDESESDTEFGLNLLGGVEFGGDFVTPFVQGRFTLGNGDALSILGGIKLGL